MNISYEVTAGSLRDLSHIDGALAEPGQDFVSCTGFVILQDGQTSVAIPVTIMEVNAGIFCLKKMNVIVGYLTRGVPVEFLLQVFLFHFIFQDEIPELQEFFLVNITSAVLMTTFATLPQLGTEASLV